MSSPEVAESVLSEFRAGEPERDPAAGPRRVLTLGGERDTRVRLSRGLTTEGFAVVHLEETRAAVELVTTGSMHGVVLAAPHPVCEFQVRTLRTVDAAIPILMVARPSEPRDQARALDAGADAYLATPFSLLVLAAQLRALIRSHGGTHVGSARADVPAPVVVHHLSVEPMARRASFAGRELALSDRQFGLLLELASQPDTFVVSALVENRAGGALRKVGHLMVVG